MSNKVEDIYSEQDFDRLLMDANENATTDWEMEFVSDLIDRWEQYGMGMFLSDKQQEHLKSIANK